MVEKLCDPEKNMPKGTVCVQKADDSQTLRFAMLFAVGCVLHRLRNREIHR